MVNIKSIFGVVSGIIAITCFIPYFRGIWNGTSKPHSYSWLIWTILQGTGALAMYKSDAGIGLAPIGIGALLCGSIFILSLKYGTKDITTFDTLCLIGALSAISLWAFTENPIFSVIIISTIDFVGFLPTFRKTYHNPNSETLSTYALSASADFLGVLALFNYSFISAFYISSRVVSNGLYALMMYIRREQI